MWRGSTTIVYANERAHILLPNCIHTVVEAMPEYIFGVYITLVRRVCHC